MVAKLKFGVKSIRESDMYKCITFFIWMVQGSCANKNQ